MPSIYALVNIENRIWTFWKYTSESLNKNKNKHIGLVYYTTRLIAVGATTNWSLLQEVGGHRYQSIT